MIPAHAVEGIYGAASNVNFTTSGRIMSVERGTPQGNQNKAQEARRALEALFKK
jgi:hypothetical protein